jgi:hypothetical protein
MPKDIQLARRIIGEMSNMGIKSATIVWKDRTKHAARLSYSWGTHQIRLNHPQLCGRI